jgi:hypothetical protein
VPSRADANPASIKADDIAELQLPSASAINFTVHGHKAVDDGLFNVSTGVEESSKFQELPEADDLTTDRYVVDRSRIRHPRMLVERCPLLSGSFNGLSQPNPWRSHEATVEASGVRIRSVLMTSVAQRRERDDQSGDSEDGRCDSDGQVVAE